MSDDEKSQVTQKPGQLIQPNSQPAAEDEELTEEEKKLKEQLKESAENTILATSVGKNVEPLTDDELKEKNKTELDKLVEEANQQTEEVAPPPQPEKPDEEITEVDGVSDPLNEKDSSVYLPPEEPVNEAQQPEATPPVAPVEQPAVQAEQQPPEPVQPTPEPQPEQPVKSAPTPENKPQEPAPQPKMTTQSSEGMPKINPPKEKMNKKPLIIGGMIFIGCLLVVGGVWGGLSLVSNNPEEDFLEEEFTHFQEEEQQQPENPNDVNDLGTPIETVPLANKSVTSDTGFTVTVEEIIRNFPTENKNQGEEVILLKIKSETDASFKTPPDKNSFFVLDDGPREHPVQVIPRSELVAQGFNEFDSNATPTKNGPVIGYLPFAIPDFTKEITFRYKRAQVLFDPEEDKEVRPEKFYDVILIED